MSPRQLVQAIEQVEQLIEKCMREQGFQYVAADLDTVRAGMKSDKHIPGLSEEEFIEKHGFGVATMYTGQPPQLSAGYSPARVGLGERNMRSSRPIAEPTRSPTTARCSVRHRRRIRGGAGDGEPVGYRRLHAQGYRAGIQPGAAAVELLQPAECVHQQRPADEGSAAEVRSGNEEGRLRLWPPGRCRTGYSLAARCVDEQRNDSAGEDDP